jgi:hypothetical protein
VRRGVTVGPDVRVRVGVPSRPVGVNEGARSCAPITRYGSCVLLSMTAAYENTGTLDCTTTDAVVRSHRPLRPPKMSLTCTPECAGTTAARPVPTGA